MGIAPSGNAFPVNNSASCCELSDEKLSPNCFASSWFKITSFGSLTLVGKTFAIIISVKAK